VGKSGDETTVNRSTSIPMAMMGMKMSMNIITSTGTGTGTGMTIIAAMTESPENVRASGSVLAI
jgi:hypothetical protein